MKKIFIIIIFLFLSQFLFCQVDTLNWKFSDKEQHGRIYYLKNKIRYNGSEQGSIYPLIVWDLNKKNYPTEPVVLDFDSDGTLNTNPTYDVILGRNSIILNSVQGLSVGNRLEIYKDSAINKWYIGKVLTINGNIVTMDSPFDYAFPTSSIVMNSIDTLNINGSVTPKSYKIHTFNLLSNDNINITKIILTMTTTNQPDMSKFGDLNALKKGILLRHYKNGQMKNIVNIKSNIGLSLFSYETMFYDNAKQGAYGLTSKIMFAGQENFGSAIEIKSGDYLELLVQDDLSALKSFKIRAEGYITNE